MVFWDIGFYFIYEVSVYVSCFGINIVVYMCKECNGRCIKREIGNYGDYVVNILFDV